MCPNETIPSVNRLTQLAEGVELLSSLRSDQAVDLNEVDWPFKSPDEAVDDCNFAISQADPEYVRDTLLNGGRFRIPFELQSDYEDIFNVHGLSRRSDRPIWRPGDQAPEDSVVPGNGQRALLDLIAEWTSDICMNHPTRFSDYLIPGDMTGWDTLMQNYMPARLTMDTWMVMPMTNYKHDWYQIWQPEFGDGDVETITLPDGETQDVLIFVGEPGPGRLVLLPPDGFHVPYDEETRSARAEGQYWVRRIEMATVALARRIARHIATQVVFEYAMPEAARQKRAILDRQQIGRAVREILGEEWFDLPFDLDGSLRNWSIDDVMKPDDEIEGMDVFIVPEEERSMYLHY